MNIKKVTPKSKADLQSENSYATHERFLTREQITEFDRLLNIPAGETSIDKFLTANPEIFTAGIHNFRTGNHAAIVIPKLVISPNIKTTNSFGMVPDFLIGGKNSDGWKYWVVEIKGADQTLFSQSSTETYFSSEINKGLCQLLQYIDFCSEHQSILRDLFKLEEFREPNGLLIAGRESELLSDPTKAKMKAAWNKVAHGKLELHTFDFINRNLETLLGFSL